MPLRSKITYEFLEKPAPDACKLLRGILRRFASKADGAVNKVNISYCVLRYKSLCWAKEITMATTVKRKEYPISMRLPEADVAMIDRAAALRGRSRTDFVRDAAVRAAEEAVMEQGLIRMSPEGFADFMDALARPAGPVPEMVELAGRPAPWEAGYDVKR